MHTVVSEEGDAEIASQFSSNPDAVRHDIVGTAPGSNICIEQTTTTSRSVLDAPSRYAPDIQGSLIPLEHGELAPANDCWGNNSAESSFTTSFHEPLFDPTQPSSQEHAALSNNPLEDREFADMLNQYRATVEQLDGGTGSSSALHRNFANPNATHDLSGYYSRNAHLDYHGGINQNAGVYAPLYVDSFTTADTQSLPSYSTRAWSDTFGTYPSGIGRPSLAGVPDKPYNYQTPLHAQISDVNSGFSYNLPGLSTTHTTMPLMGHGRAVKETPRFAYADSLPLAESSDFRHPHELLDPYGHDLSHRQFANASAADQLPATESRHNSDARRTSMSEGELSQPEDNHNNIDGGYLSDGEVETGERQITSPLIATTEKMQKQNLVDSSCDNVTKIVKQRLADILQRRDPKLLQAPEFRGLMLLLRCIKLDDPEDIYSHIKNAPIAVASELDVLAHEFSLDMISDACINVVLAADTGACDSATGADMSAILAEGNGTSCIIGNSVAPDQNDTTIPPQSPASNSVDMDTQASSANSRVSSPEVDMDTSSDIGYESASTSQAPWQGAVDVLPEAFPFAQPPPSTPNSDTFSRQQRFDRSCAPSPPYMGPRTPKSSAPGSRLSALRDTNDIPRTVLGAAILPELAETRDTEEDGSSDMVTRPPSFISRPSSSNRLSELVDQESLVCNSEHDCLIAFIEEGGSQFGSDSGSDSDVEDNNGGATDRLIQRSKVLHKANMHRKRHGQRPTEDSFNSLRIQNSAGLPSLEHSAVETHMPPKKHISSAPKDVNVTLQRAKTSLKEKEAAIAELKLQISQRQARALLQKKQHQSKRQAEHLPSNVVSASSTPLSKDDQAGVFMPAVLKSKAKIRSTTSGSADSVPSSDEAVVETSNVDTSSNNRMGALVGASSSAAARHGDSPVDDIHMNKLHLEESLLPRSVCNEKTLAKVTSEVRLKHVAAVAEYLSNAANAKQTALKCITRRSEHEGIAATAHQDLYAQTPELLVEQRLRLTQKRATVNAHITQLQAELELAKIELSCIDYNIQSSHECEELHSMGDVASRHPGSNEKLAATFASDIHEIQKLRDAIPCTTVSRTLLPNHGTSSQANKQSPISSGKSKAAELKAKLVAMQKDQSTMAQKLGVLAEKRKQQNITAPIKQSSKKKKRKTNKSTSMRIGQIRDMLPNWIWTNTSPYERWCKGAVSAIDNVLLQPLFLVDGIGVPNAVVPPINVNARTWDADPITEPPASSVYSIISTSPVSKASLNETKYTSYESPLGGISSTNDENGTLATQPTAYDLARLSTDHLFAAVKISAQQTNTLKQYYREVSKALEVFCESDKDLDVPNAEIARALLPVWNYYKHILPMRGIVPENPLYNVLGLADINISDAEGGLDLGARELNKEITMKEGQLLGRLLSKGDQFLPILNQDVACIPASYKKRCDGNLSAAHSGRYFDASADRDNGDEDGEVYEANAGADNDADSSASSDTDNDDINYAGVNSHTGTRKSGEGSGSGNAAGSESQDSASAFYQRAIRALWRGAPKLKRPIRVYDFCIYLQTKANPRLGKIILSLKRALQDWPDSEELWDLYLELYTRQRPPAEEAVAAFSDATRLHPTSVCLWRRYAYWCGYNAAHSKKSPKAASGWQMRMAEATASAIQHLSDAQTVWNAEQISATIAALLIHFWECSWAVVNIISAAPKQPDGIPTSGQLKPQLLAHMCACLCATSNSTLSDEISAMCLSAMGKGSKKALITAWDCTEWTLAKLLLPHHLLLVGQVYVSTFIKTSFLPHMVTLQILVALHAPIDYHSTFFIDLDKITEGASADAVEHGLLQPYMVSILCKLFGGMLQVLNKLNEAGWPSNFDTRSLVASRTLCLASINTSLVLLRRQHPKALESHRADCEQILWRIRAAQPGSPDIRRAVDAMATMEVYKFLIVSQALCKGTFPGTGGEATDAAAMLWMHAVLVAENAGIDVAGLKTACESHTTSMNDESDVGTGSDEVLRQKIVDTRALYYRIIGYTSAFAPLSSRMLSLSIDRNTTLDGFHRQIHESAGVWTNLALLELLYANRCIDDGANPIKQSVESAMLWLRFGLQQVLADSLGARAQIWAVLFRLCMTQRSLVTKDILEMHRDLGGDATDNKALHRSPQRFAFINFVLCAVLQNAPSDGTLAAIGNYLSAAARQNSVLAIR
ncbi:hypothetical protein H4R24_000659 [Coemansia sp. RSA 988]|nr:hypothetical protein H4R24_000659 [Coemansia sp. RSA 988]